MKAYSLKTRLLICAWVALLVFLLPVYIYLDNFLRKSAMDDAISQAAERLTTAVWLLSSHHPYASDRELQDWVNALSLRLGSRISIIRDGRLTADSSLPFSQLAQAGDFSDRPEILRALSGERGYDVRRSALLEWDYLYAAAPLRNVPGLENGILRLSVPLAKVYANLPGIRLGLIGLLVGLMLAITGIITLWSKPFLTSINTMAETARAVGRGNFSLRVCSVRGKELRPLAEAINAMAYNTERHVLQLREQNEQLLVLFTGMREGIMLLDENGRVLAVNPALVLLFPQAGEMTGATVFEATGQTAIQSAVDDLLANEKTGGTTLTLDMGRRRSIEASLVPFGHAPQQRIILVFHDMTERVYHDRMRRDFVASITHELKTPLTSIKGYAETLLDAPPSTDIEQIENFLHTILRNTDHMTKLINNMLNLARAEHHGESIACEAVDAVECARVAQYDMVPQAETKGVRLIHSLPDAPIWVYAGAEGLIEIIRILLDNAIKYSPDNSRVHTSCTSEANGLVTLRICDEGPGIPEESRERIFERFYRLERDSREPAKDGSAGLGLAIGQRLTRAFGGEIWVESPKKGPGACFCVSLNPSPPPEGGGTDDGEALEHLAL